MNYFKKKIFTIDDLCTVLKGEIAMNPCARIALCAGNFDILHPGHHRHLEWAKEKCDILIASVTADYHITKGADRPYVPQELRAKNLASLETVNFVVIDQNPTPIEIIKKIRPNFFVKGFEYSDLHNPKTKEEVETVESYGGHVLFSPGDVVYSSTKLLSMHKPKISVEKLLALMEAEGVTFDDVLTTIEKFSGVKVLVVGDLIVDKYSYCSVLGPTTKTPTFSVKLNKSELFVGGAGIVAKHLKSLGAEVELASVAGDDEMGKFAFDDLDRCGIDTYLYRDGTRPTTVKERFWADGYKLLQVDVVDNHAISDDIVEKIRAQIAGSGADIVVFSDFRHGVFNKGTIKLFSECVKGGVIKVADSQVSNRWGNILDFEEFTLITPNEKEARFSLGDGDSGIRALGAELYRQSNAKYLILKLGEKGILTYRSGNENPRDFFSIDSFVEELSDGVGAGDAMLAGAALGLKCGNILIASIVGSLAAAVECEKQGNVPVEINELKNKISRIMD